MNPTQWYGYKDIKDPCGMNSPNTGRFDLAYVIRYRKIARDQSYHSYHGTRVSFTSGRAIEITTPYDDFCAVMDKYNAPPSDALRPQANPLPKGDA